MPMRRRRLLDSFWSLRYGTRSLSAADRQRLDDHMARIAELQRKLGAKVSCGDVQMPSDGAQQHFGNNPEDAIKYGQLWNEVVAAAFRMRQQSHRSARLKEGLDASPKQEMRSALPPRLPVCFPAGAAVAAIAARSSMDAKVTASPSAEFIALVALTTSLVAMSID